MFYKLYLFTFCFLFAIKSNFGQAAAQKTKNKDGYQCAPCGNNCDNDTYNTAGKCRTVE